VNDRFRKNNDLVLFFCRDMVHDVCVPSNDYDGCAL